MNTLKLYTHENEVGFIRWYNPEIDEESNLPTIIISGLYINDSYQGRGIGSLLIVSMFGLLVGINQVKFQLDDCSEHGLQRNNIYYKIGFRIDNDVDLEKMSIFINCNPTRGSVPYIYTPGDCPEIIKNYNSINNFISGISNITKLTNKDLHTFKFMFNDNDVTLKILRRLKKFGKVDYNTRKCNRKFGKKKYIIIN
jgi:hypothetical protein